MVTGYLYCSQVFLVLSTLVALTENTTFIDFSITQRQYSKLYWLGCTYSEEYSESL